MPLIGLVTVTLLHIVSWLDPKLRWTLDRNDRMHNILQILRVTLAGLFDSILSVQIAAALGRIAPPGRILNASILIIFAVLSNYMGNLRPNYFVGIRTPWTLENPETWRATHRVGARLMFFGSVLLLIVQFFVTQQAAFRLLISSTLLLALWAFVYSWHHFRTHAATRETV